MTAEQIAYKWFIRLAAMRFMVGKGYFDCHTTRDNLIPRATVLHQAMPGCFDKLTVQDIVCAPYELLDEFEAVLPSNCWGDVVVMGWLHQFWISPDVRKARDKNRAFEGDEIKTVTQLFTPNWICQYLVQNSLGRQWLQTYPDSPLRHKMPYYIEPAEQTPEVQAQLDAITPASLDPKKIKMLEPCVGTGNILIEMYRTMRWIYVECGHPLEEIPSLIIENNIFGLDICDDVIKIAIFTLLMLGLDDDRRLLEKVAW